MKTEILYGINPVFEALKADRRKVFEIYIAKDKTSGRIAKIVKFAQSKKIPVKKVKTTQLKSIAENSRHQGISAKVDIYAMADLSDIIGSDLANDNNRFLLLLDNVLDPQNLGAIIRTALGVGIDGIIIPKDRSAMPTPAVSKASAGAIEHVRMIRITNMVDTIKVLKQQGVWVVGLDKGADKTVYSSDLTGSVAIIIGGEEKGIRPLVKKNCDFLVSIPQMGQVNSLNASVAAAIVMYEAFRQREKQRKEPDVRTTLKSR
jgi:23S rRNA (guanosine2251-2'-O)-methyltransferase